eukprot:SAG25_NODE_2651_length_1469_cov_2.612409_1_plen_102_part_01
MLLAQVTDSHVRTVEAPHAAATAQGSSSRVSDDAGGGGSGGGRHLSAHPRATLEACLRQAFGDVAGDRPHRTVPQLLVLTGDNAHGDSEGGAPYAPLRHSLA